MIPVNVPQYDEEGHYERHSYEAIQGCEDPGCISGLSLHTILHCCHIKVLRNGLAWKALSTEPPLSSGIPSMSNAVRVSGRLRSDHFRIHIERGAGRGGGGKMKKCLFARISCP